jgi:hypothetical protein
VLMRQRLTFDQNIFGFSQGKGLDRTILYGRMIGQATSTVRVASLVLVLEVSP